MPCGRAGGFPLLSPPAHFKGGSMVYRVPGKSIEWHKENRVDLWLEIKAAELKALMDDIHTTWEKHYGQFAKQGSDNG